MASEFKVGDVVRLKSGSPKMTISTIDSFGVFQVTWFDGTKASQLVVDPGALVLDDGQDE